LRLDLARTRPGRIERELAYATPAVRSRERAFLTLQLVVRLCQLRVIDRDRGEPCGPTPPTPPYIRVRIRRFEKLR